jgi:hypothetical protein
MATGHPNSITITIHKHTDPGPLIYRLQYTKINKSTLHRTFTVLRQGLGFCYLYDRSGERLNGAYDVSVRPSERIEGGEIEDGDSDSWDVNQLHRQARPGL